jgi:hypothetical protein
MWRRFEAEGTSWEVSTSPADAAGAGEWERAETRGTGGEERGERSRAEDAESFGPGELLEFRSGDPNRPPRRLFVHAGRLDLMDDEALRRALRQARPIGGDFYGRPGKHMEDAP